MSKPNGSWNAVAIGIISIFLGVVAFVFSQSIFDLFFVAIIVAVLWDYSDKVRRLEEKLLQVEARLPPDQSRSTQEQTKT